MPVPCYFTDKIHLAYRSYIGQYIKGKEKIGHPTARQCPYCEHFFAKTEENMKHHIKICAAQESITCSFNNGDISVLNHLRCKKVQRI